MLTLIFIIVTGRCGAIVDSVFDFRFLFYFELFSLSFLILDVSIMSCHVFNRPQVKGRDAGNAVDGFVVRVAAARWSSYNSFRSIH